MIKLASFSTQKISYTNMAVAKTILLTCLSFLNGNILNDFDSVSVISQKGESQNGCYKATKHTKFSEKKIYIFPTPDMQTYVCVSGDKK